MNDLARLLAQQLRLDGAALRTSVRRGALAERRLERCLSTDDVRRLARRRLPRFVFDQVESGANDEVTLRRNEADFSQLCIYPRALVDLPRIDLSTTVLGQPVAFPVLGAPTGLNGLLHPRGELALAAGFRDAGSIFVLSNMASYSVEDVTAVTGAGVWFQLYLWRDRGFIREVLERARAAGCPTLMVTVDSARIGVRYRSLRSGFTMPPRVTVRSVGQALARPPWAARFVADPRITMPNAIGGGAVRPGPRARGRLGAGTFDDRVTWSDIEAVRELWPGSLVVKGILHPDDALEAVRAGADAVGVSNHGGRQLDHSPSTISVLPSIVDAVADDAEVYLDGGVRRGSDVLKSVALGARACLVGRVALYGLAAGGAAGVARALAILRDELEVALALAGCPSVERLAREHLCTHVPFNGTAA